MPLPIFIFSNCFGNLQESGSEKSALAYKAAVEKYMGNSARFFTLLNQPEDKKDIRSMSIIVCTAKS